LTVDPPVTTTEVAPAPSGVDLSGCGRLPLPDDGYVWITDAQAGAIASALGLPFYLVAVGVPVRFARLDPGAGSISGDIAGRTVKKEAPRRPTRGK
jgi:hypothetical protein